MPAIPQTFTWMSSPPHTWRRGLLVTANEVIAMVVTSEATREAEDGEEANLPVEKVNSQAGKTIHTRGRMTQFGRIAKILTLPVAAPPKTARKSIHAVIDYLVELFAIRRRMEGRTTRRNTDYVTASSYKH